MGTSTRMREKAQGVTPHPDQPSSTHDRDEIQRNVQAALGEEAGQSPAWKSKVLIQISSRQPGSVGATFSQPLGSLGANPWDGRVIQSFPPSHGRPEAWVVDCGLWAGLMESGRALVKELVKAIRKHQVATVLFCLAPPGLRSSCETHQRRRN